MYVILQDEGFVADVELRLVADDGNCSTRLPCRSTLLGSPTMVDKSVAGQGGNMNQDLDSVVLHLASVLVQHTIVGTEQCAIDSRDHQRTITHTVVWSLYGTSTIADLRAILQMSTYVCTQQTPIISVDWRIIPS